MSVCPFCGVATDSPHETQGACIEALQAEISRVRKIVGRFKEEAPVEKPDPLDDSVQAPTAPPEEPSDR
jgi:hypothetical protein